MGYSPIVPYITKIALLTFVVFSNIYSTKKNIPEFDVFEYVRRAFLPSFLTLIVVLTVTYWVYIQFDDSGLLRFLIVCITSTITTALSTYFIVFEKNTRQKVNKKIFLKFHK